MELSRRDLLSEPTTYLTDRKREDLEIGQILHWKLETGNLTLDVHSEISSLQFPVQDSSDFVILPHQSL
jgi:hypothetical protein